MKVVKQGCIVYRQTLSDICNKSYTQGVFPDNMNIGKVIPLYKAGDRNVFFSKLKTYIIVVSFQKF